MADQPPVPLSQQPQVQKFPPGVQSGSAPADPAQQAVNGSDAGGARAVGTVQDARDAQTNPAAAQTVDPKEQLELEQFISRFTLILSDTGKNKPAHATGPSPNAAILQSLNNPKVPLPEAIGRTTAQIAMMIVQQAQAQKITYSPDVLFGANFECCALVYITGNAHGIFKGVPSFRGMEKDGTYDFNDAELKIITSAQMQAVRYFGNMEMKAGMISPQVRKQNLAFWQQQIQREVSSGAVNEDALKKVASLSVMNKGQPAAADPTQPQPQPAAAPAPPPQAQPQPQAAPQGISPQAGA